MIAEWICKKKYIHRSIREFLIKIISPDFNKGHTFETDFFGLRWPGTTSNYIDYQVLLRGAYEKFMLFFMRDVVVSLPKTETVFLDVGANIGNHSLFMSKYAPIVHAFEPYEPVREALKKKITLNRIKNVIVHPKGLSCTKEIIPFYSPSVSNLGTGSFEKEYCADNKQTIIPLAVVIGDEEISEHDISGIGLIKIDVEGHERQVIKGLRQTLETNRPVVIFESSPATKDSLETFENMTSLFPDQYSFYIFSTKNKKNGRYKLRQLTTMHSLDSNEIIAFPQEKIGHILEPKT
ncbi:MAG: FkbM family methyltransferase [Desulfobacula sp.]|uniref:FkbM family methyltransferase n=1 Tax=Desulfobacula sp. TaxID=2593537 RepID=UPI0025BA1BB7|nr:FkbM family methyltransferase [Desulfobacula sp.]MCD4721461.1 FkbM family methyltransferase [Desulfobacula sp.]